jgi:hypothetical protein
MSRPRPLDLFFAHMGWTTAVTLHKDFPLTNFTSGVDFENGKIYVGCTDIRTGEIVSIPDDREKFPSPTLVAAFRLLCGPMTNVLADASRTLGRRPRFPGRQGRRR